MRLVTAYATIADGGQKINATLIDRIQDRFGRTIYQHDQRKCEGCDADGWTGQHEPTLVDDREQVLDPMTAYQITSMMEGVVKRGTATVVQKVGKPIAGKTGTTNDEKDAWFVGFSPDLVCRRLHRLRQAAADGTRTDRRRARRADLHRVHEGGAAGPAAEGVPGAAGHLADPDRPPHRTPRAGRRSRRDPGGLQAGDGAADDKCHCLSMEIAGPAAGEFRNL